MLKHTPLFEVHQKLGGRLIEFGGWEMPVQYAGILDEHRAVRTRAGLFDVSHMGKVKVRGAGAAAFLNQTLTNDVGKLRPGLGQYTLMCNERGGVVDDLYTYQVDQNEFLLIINASRIEADGEWLQRRQSETRLAGDFQLEDLSAQFGIIAVQGPRAPGCLKVVLPGGSRGGTAVGGVTELKKNEAGLFLFGGRPLLTARTGYTGEDGFEMIVPSELLVAVWGRCLEVGRECGLVPAGLGARDTLRTEACYPLYGHELDEQTTPLEAGLGYFVCLEKEFVGGSVLAEQKRQGVAKKGVAFKMSGASAPPRPQYTIRSPGAAGTKLGVVTSGTQSPTLGLGIGMGYVPPASAVPGTAIEIEIRGRPCPAMVVAKPFYRRPTGA